MKQLPARTLLPFALCLATASLAHAQCEVQKVVASDPGANDWFGFATDLDGDTALIGAVWDTTNGPLDGSAYVFERQGTVWVETAKLVAHDAGTDDMLGISVSISGDWALCGSYRDDDIADNAGSAYLFERTPSGWVERQKLKASDAAAFDRFGWGVASDGDTLVVGAYQDDDVGAQSGSAYVFELQGTVWVETAKLTASDGSAGDFLGKDVAIHGDVIVAGAQTDDDAGVSSGSAYVFERQGTAWVETAKLTASDASAGSGFGVDVFVQGDRILVGARAADSAASNGGAAYVFERAGSEWMESQILSAPDVATSDDLGISVALSGNRAIVGSRRDDDGGFSSGSAYVFENVGGSWIVVTKLTASDADASDEFGYAVSLDGETALVGAMWNDDSFGNAGSAYFYQVPSFVTPFGRCPASAPCGNSDPLAGCANSTGSGARLTACGSGSVATDDLVLSLSSLPAGQFGLVYMGTGQTQVPFGDGLRVIGLPGTETYRFPARVADAGGTLSEGPGIVAHAQATFGVSGQILAGSTWLFQGWFRDPFGPCGSGFNLSNGLSVTFE